MGGGLTATLARICAWRQYTLALLPATRRARGGGVACDVRHAAPNSSWAICKVIKFDCFLARNVWGKNCINKHFEAKATPTPPPPTFGAAPTSPPRALISSVCYFVISWLRIYGFILSIFMCPPPPTQTSNRGFFLLWAICQRIGGDAERETENDREREEWGSFFG